MSTVPAKQIIKILSSFIRVSGFSASASSNTVTAALTTALATAGDGGVSVPLQVSNSNGVGVVTAAPSNRVEVYNATSKDKILAGNGEEVYGRITEATGTYTLSYYTLDNTGAETAYTFGAATNIDFEFIYRFDFARFPTDGVTGVSARNISSDPSAAGGSLYREQLTVTATNTLSNASKTPISANVFTLTVNGIAYDTFGGAAARVAVNLTTKAVTWSAANAGFSLETTDRAIAEYTTNE